MYSSRLSGLVPERDKLVKRPEIAELRRFPKYGNVRGERYNRQVSPATTVCEVKA